MVVATVLERRMQLVLPLAHFFDVGCDIGRGDDPGVGVLALAPWVLERLLVWRL